MEDNLILENFNAYLTENAELFTEATSAMSIVTDQVTYDSYAMFDRQREVLLEESASLLGSPDAITYAVTSFPMLVDIYADPLLSKVVSVYPSNVPTMSIPRLKWISKVIDHKGAVTEVEFPTATSQVRGNQPIISFGQSANVFTKLFEGTTTTNFSQFRLNKRNFKVTEVTVNGDFEATGTPADAVVSLIAVADARGNFAAEDLTVSNAAGAVVSTFKIQGQINFESGDITWSAINLSGVAVASVSAKAKVRIMGVGNGLAVVKARPKQDILDINCDIEDSFEIENIEEVIQDWKSLYNLDIISQLKGYVKDQIDLSTIAGATATKPASVQDIFKNIIRY